jgi:zinc protease
MSSLPPSLQEHRLPGHDDILRVELPNGIVVLARANFNSPSVLLGGFLQAGSLFDPEEKLGLSEFTAAMLMRGTQQRSFQAIFHELESVGAGLGIDSGAHTTGFGGRSLAEDLDLLLDLLAESLLCPVFPEEYVERVRGQFLTGLNIRAQDTGEQAAMAFDSLVYAGHPYSRPEDGYPETIRAITRSDLEEFHRRHYGPRGLVIAIAGGVSPAVAAEKVEKALGRWENAGQPLPPALPPLAPLLHTVEKRVSIAGKSQADLVIGASGPQRSSPDFVAASLGNHILGQFGMYGRIGEVVRQQAGLAYYAYSSLSGGVGPGPWDVSAGVHPDQVDRAVELITREITRFVTEPPEETELEDSKSNYIGRLPLSMESNGGVVGALLSLERFNLGLDYYRQYPAMIAAVTREDVLAAARRYLDPDRLAIAVAGP